MGAEIGLLGIEPETRRRTRLNGTISARTNDALTVAVRQAFGNCPQYIAKRVWRPAPNSPKKITATRHTRLTGSMQEWIGTADTLFLASGYQKGGENRDSDGMDISHRGGSAGFVTVAGPGELILPDYAGNNLFNTLGNLVMDPRVGVLFVDFEQGSLLQITGRATIDWDSPRIAEHPGAQRLVYIAIDEIVRLQHGVPLRWDESEGAIRELQIQSKTRESDDVISIELVARDGGDLPAFRAGQYLPIEIPVDEKHSLERTYSLSGDPAAQRFRITVKKEEHGLVSRLLHNRYFPGDTLYAQAPEGGFVLAEGDRPVTLISGGIGITPMVSMLHSLARQDRVFNCIYGTRDGAHAPLLQEVHGLATNNPNVHLAIVFSQPRPGQDIEGRDYHRSGHIDAAVVDEFIPGTADEFYVCGPKEFLASIVLLLTERGVKEKDIHLESFT